MARGGKRPGAGRKKQSKTRETTIVTAAFGPHETLTSIAQRHEELAFEVLVEVAADRKCTGSARTTAAGMILDRARGKAPQVVDHTGKVEHEHKLTDLEAARRIAFLLNKAARGKKE